MAATPQLVTMQQVKDHVLVDHDLDDAKLTDISYQASAIVLNYLKQHERGPHDTLPVYDPANPTPVSVSTWPWVGPVSSQPPFYWPPAKVIYRELPRYLVPEWLNGSPGGVPYDVQAATLLVAGALYADREGKASPISPAVEALLERWRDPAVA